MRDPGKTFSPGRKDIFWCRNCNLPLLSSECSICHSQGERIRLSPPADIRLCSLAGRELLADLFSRQFGTADLLKGRIILLNKIAGIDRRDQVILDGLHIATLWFDITAGCHRLDLELAGASLLADRAEKGVVVCHDHLWKGHLKGKWLSLDQIVSQPEDLAEGDSIVLKMGKLVGVGVVRLRESGSKSIRIKDVTRERLALCDRETALEQAVLANQAHLEGLERMALRELKDYLSRTRLPVNVSFSGGKDSLAALCLLSKVRPDAEVLFINTGLEFPETVQYVREFCRLHRLRLHEILGEGDIFSQVKSFGPPAKDYRWCCKTHKLGPLAAFLQQHYPKGCVTIEGRRIYESFNRSTIKAVERNPYVPGQTTLSPIRDWTALEVMLYLRWNGWEPNPLYEQDFERIGCWLCPASLQSEFASLRESHPQLHERWTSCLKEWAVASGLDGRYIDWGFWRWKSHPPKMLEIAKAHGLDLKARLKEKEEIALQVMRGRSPCGLEYSIEAALSVPQNHPFPAVVGGLCLLGDVRFAEDLGAAVVKTETGRATVFASGHIMITAPQKAAEELLRAICAVILRVQLCTRCMICMKSCRQGAISVQDTIAIDSSKCSRCKRCESGCIAADRAERIIRDLIAPA